MPNDVDKFVASMGALVESCKIIYDAAVSGGFSNDQAFKLANDFFQMIINDCIERKNDVS